MICYQIGPEQILRSTKSFVQQGYVLKAIIGALVWHLEEGGGI